MAHILYQNLKRNRLRNTLTAVAFALPMAIFVGAISMVMALVQISKSNAQELRLATHHKTTIINMLPEGMRQNIEAFDPERKRLRAVCGMRWFGGRIPNTPIVVQSLAADADTFPIVYSDAGMTPADIEEWQKDKIACVVGFGVAQNNQWRLGQKIHLQSSVPPYLKLEFKIVKIMMTESRQNVLYFRRDYLTEALKTADAESPMCNIFWIKCQDVEAMRSLQDQIDSAFANSPNETKSEDELAFAAGFIQATGNIPGLMQAIAIVVVVIIALVAGNTMMMSFRERTRELAVFKAIGFPRWRIFVMVMGESLLLAFVGALCGVIPAATALLLFPMRMANFPPIAALKVSPGALAASISIALFVGLLAGLWPTYQALRLNTVSALRRA